MAEGQVRGTSARVLPHQHGEVQTRASPSPFLSPRGEGKTFAALEIDLPPLNGQTQPHLRIVYRVGGIL